MASTKRAATAANWLSEHHFADVVAAALCRRARRDNGSCLDRARWLQSERVQFTRTKSERSRLGMANLQASRTKPRERDSYSRNPILPSSSHRCAKDDRKDLPAHSASHLQRCAMFSHARFETIEPSWAK